MSRRSRRNRRRNRNRKKESYLQKLIRVSNLKADIITAKEDYYINGKSNSPLFIKNLKYECIKLNDDFYKITYPANNKSVVITTNLFTEIFI